MREILHVQAGQCGNQIGAKVNSKYKLKIDTICELVGACCCGKATSCLYGFYI